MRLTKNPTNDLIPIIWRRAHFVSEPDLPEWGGGAGDETRTRDINLGKVALYQLSYTRAREAKNSWEAARVNRGI
jgi:hypothetical protein